MFADHGGLAAAIEADLAALPEMSGETESEEDRTAGLRHELWADPAVRGLLDDLWPALTPERLLADLFADPARLAAAAPVLTDAERAALLARARAAGPSPTFRCWTRPPSCSATTTGPTRARRHASTSERIAYAQGVLDIAAGSRRRRADGGTVLTASDLLDAERLADRHETRSRPYGGRARRRGPDLDVRSRDRGRGAGAVARWPGGS